MTVSRRLDPAVPAELRERRGEDLDACVELLRQVHARDGYPVRWPTDPHGWLTPSNLIAAWVVERDGELAAHAVLRGAEGTAGADPLAAATGLPAEQIALIARLFVAPAARRAGLAGLLLERAATESSARHLLLALDVVGSHSAPIALYERAGWRRVATVPWKPAAGGDEQPLHCYVAPPHGQSGRFVHH